MVTSPSTAPSSTPKKVTQAPRRRRSGVLNLLLLVVIIVTISLFVWAEQQRREAQQKLSQTAGELEELRKSAETSGQEVADRVLGNLRKHMDIPTDPQPTVATIVDAAALKESNEFYQPAENGDHLIITSKRAILYDPERDIILDVVPVSVDASQQAAEGQASPSPTQSPVASPSATPTTLPSGSPTPLSGPGGAFPPATTSPTPALVP